MAVNTRNRRAACIGLALPFLRVRPTPDGSLGTEADRRHMTFLYRGLRTNAGLIPWLLIASEDDRVQRQQFLRLSLILQDIRNRFDALNGDA